MLPVSNTARVYGIKYILSHTTGRKRIGHFVVRVKLIRFRISGTKLLPPIILSHDDGIFVYQYYRSQRGEAGQVWKTLVVFLRRI